MYGAYNPAGDIPDPATPIFIHLILILIPVALIIAVFRIYFRSKRRARGLGSLCISSPDAASGIIFGRKACRVVYSPASEEGHVIVFGGSGSGKTSAVLIPTLRSLRKNNRSTVFCIDIAGDISGNAAAGMRNTLIYAPGSGKSIPYSPFSTIDSLETEEDRNEALENIAFLLMPELQDASANAQFFHREGRKILTSALIAGYHSGMDFINICEHIAEQSYQALFEWIDKTGYQSAIRYINGFEGSSPQNTAGCMQSAAAAVALFANNTAVKQSIRRPRYREDYYTPTALEEYNVFVVLPDDKIDLYQPLMQLLVSQTIQYLSTRSLTAKHTIILCLDELPSLGHLPVLDVVRKFRKRKIRLLALTQSLADLDLTYGERERVAILENFRYTLVLSASSIETQQYFSKRIGNVRRKQITTTSRMYDRSTVSETETREPAINPQDLARLGDHLILLYPGGYIQLKKNYYFKQPDFSVLEWLTDRIDDFMRRRA